MNEAIVQVIWPLVRRHLAATALGNGRVGFAGATSFGYCGLWWASRLQLEGQEVFEFMGLLKMLLQHAH